MEEGADIKVFLLPLSRENVHSFIPSSDWDHYQQPERETRHPDTQGLKLQTQSLTSSSKIMSEMSVPLMSPKPGMEEYTEIII